MVGAICGVQLKDKKSYGFDVGLELNDRSGGCGK